MLLCFKGQNHIINPNNYNKNSILLSFNFLSQAINKL